MVVQCLHLCSSQAIVVAVVWTLNNHCLSRQIMLSFDY